MTPISKLIGRRMLYVSEGIHSVTLQKSLVSTIKLNEKSELLRPIPPSLSRLKVLILPAGVIENEGEYITLERTKTFGFWFSDKEKLKLPIFKVSKVFPEAFIYSDVIKFTREQNTRIYLSEMRGAIDFILDLDWDEKEFKVPIIILARVGSEVLFTLETEREKHTLKINYYEGKVKKEEVVRDSNNYS